MLTITHKLSQHEADRLKEALLRTFTPGMDVVSATRELIEAFAVIDAATEFAS